MMRSHRLRRLALLATVFSAPGMPALAASFTVTAGTTDTAPKQVSGSDTGIVQAGGALISATNPAINWNGTSTGLTITNSGTISSTAADGRAINAASGDNNRSIVLTNNAGAVIESQNDAFRINVNPTGGTIVVNNAGVIRTTVGGQALDFDAAASGAASIQINNLAGGQLRSVGQDAIRPGQGAVVNNSGVIRSEINTVYDNYDGIDWQNKSGTVINNASGAISGVRHGITSDVDVSITNEAGGVIEGRNGSGIGSDGVGTVVNRGRITGRVTTFATPPAGGDGDGVDIDGVGSIDNAGVIEGLGAYGVDSGGRPNGSDGVAMGGGTIINRLGALISGANKGVLIDDGGFGGAFGATSITNAGVIQGLNGPAIRFVGDFADTISNSGTISATGGAAIELGGGADTLNISTGSIISGLVDGGAGSDVVNLSGGGAFGATANFESLNVQSGAWTLSGFQTYNATTIASGARVNLSGTLNGAIALSGGGQIGGTGTAGALTSAGRIAPGNSIGTLNVASLTLLPSSVYEVEVDAAGQSDRINVTTTANLGGQVQVLAVPGGYAPQTQYVIVSAGAINGVFNGATSNLAFLVPELSYTANQVRLTLRRNDVSFAQAGVTGNAARAGEAAGGLGVLNPVYRALLSLDAAQAWQTLAELSGEIHPAVTGALSAHNQPVREHIAQRLAGEATGAWATTTGSARETGRVPGRAFAKDRTYGAMFGGDGAIGPVKVGLSIEDWTQTVRLPARSASARVEGLRGGVYAGTAVEGLSLAIGADLSRYRTTSTRLVGGGLNQTLDDFNVGRGVQAFAEGSVAIGGVQPFFGLNWETIETGPVMEDGGSAGLRSPAIRAQQSSATYGVRMTQKIGEVTPRVQLAWTHIFDAASAEARFVFRDGGPSFLSRGPRVDADTLSARLGADFDFNDRVSLVIDLHGRKSEHSREYGGTAGMTVRF